jgi:hypothetical protein
MRRIRPQNNSPRNGLWSQSKYTNLTTYDPYYSEIDTLTKRSNIIDHTGDTRYIKQPPANGLKHAIEIADIKHSLKRIPEHFTNTIKGIFLCSGSSKQRRMNTTTFGCYSGYYQSIFLFPFYEDKNLFFNTYPKPSLSMEYERHGATWVPCTQGGYFSFDDEALRSFYIWDVLYHEVGHHVDFMSSDWDHKSYNARERFAEWFAIEYGMRKKKE